MPPSSSGTCPQDTPQRRVLVAVCTYNEAGNIGELLAQLRAALPVAELLVVDDHSPDGTGDVVRRFAETDPATRLIVREGQRGLGGAIRRAFAEAVSGDYEWLINLDGDLSHDPAQLPHMIAVATEPPHPDVVVGSRYVAGGTILGWPLHRRLMSRLVNRFATLCLRLPVSDCSGSMRCYRTSALKQIKLNELRSHGYALLEEILVELDRNGATFAEVPIVFADRTRGSSKLTLGEAVRSASQIVKLSFSR